MNHKIASELLKVAEILVADEIDEAVEFNKDVLKEIKKLKKDLGATKIRVNYRGTGSKRADRQVFVRFGEGGYNDVIDIWVQKGGTTLGGIYNRLKVPPISHEGKTPAQVYKIILKYLTAWRKSNE